MKRLVSLIVVLGACVLSATARADLPGRPLAITAQSPGNVQVFWSSGSGQLVEANETDGSWAPAQNTPVSGLTSDPAAVVYDNSVYLFYAGADHNLWEVTDSAGSWSTPIDLNTGVINSDPTADEWARSGSDDEIDVFWATPSGSMGEVDWESDAPGWSPAFTTGGSGLSSAPTAASFTQSTSTGVTTWWRSAPSSLDEYYYSEGPESWYGPSAVASTEVTGPPSDANLPTGTQDIFWQGSNSDLWLEQWTPANGFAGPGDQGIAVASAPTAATASATEVDVVWEADDSVWETADRDGTLEDIQRVDSLTPPPAVQTTPQPVTITPATPTPTTGPGATKQPTKPALHVKITFRATWNHDTTRIRDLRFAKLPARSGVRITCTGKDCPKNLGLTTARYRLSTLITHVDADTFRVGQTITIIVGHTGDTAQKVRLTIRRGAEPAARLL